MRCFVHFENCLAGPTDWNFQPLALYRTSAAVGSFDCCVTFDLGTSVQTISSITSPADLGWSVSFLEVFGYDRQQIVECGSNEQECCGNKKQLYLLQDKSCPHLVWHLTRTGTTMAAQQTQQKYLNLFERMGEPVFLPKRNGTQFILPQQFYPTEYQNNQQLETVALRIAAGRPVVRHSVTSRVLPDLSRVTVLPRGQPLSLFIPSHRAAAYALVDIFMGIPNFDDMIDTAALIRDRVNEQVFVYAYSAALTQRKDARARGAVAPPIWEVFPEKFIERNVLRNAIRNVKDSEYFQSITQISIDRNFTANDRIPENRVSYFREDLGINSHHWHWHLVYPLEGTRRDRRGELFYYMHSQIIARYDAERLANGLNRVIPLDDLRKPLTEGYFPKLTNSIGGYSWAGRPSGLVIQDVHIPDTETLLGLDIRVNDLERWISRIMHAIHKGAIDLDQHGNTMALDEATGTDILGNIIESTSWSRNPLLYGDLHNLGHTLITFIHDPNGGHLENMAVMADSTVSMRDPLFYRWHKFVDGMFREFKATLQPHTAQQLTFPGISLSRVGVATAPPSNGRQYNPTNTLYTGWQDSIISLDRGLDFGSSRPVLAKVRHLQHRPFTYHFYVNNTTTTQQEVCFRVFIAPLTDVTRTNFSLRDLFTLMIEMDKFVDIIPPNGKEVIRRSSESSVTIPFEQTFRDLERPQPIRADAGNLPISQPALSQRTACGCGWPENMLVPRGTIAPGMPFKLFVMATDWRQDRAVTGTTADKNCSKGASYCGVLDQLYPDRKPMGYPFDKPPPRRSVIADWLTPNMQVADIRIVFEDEVIATRN